jgi:competence protein ComEC
VTGWLLPTAAAAFWAGIGLRAGGVLGGVRPWLPIAIGGGALLVAAAAAPRRSSGTGHLERAGLVEDPLPALVAVAGPRSGPARAPPLLIALAIASSFTLLGVGWAELRAPRPVESVLARLPAGNVQVVGVLRSDPVPGLFGWTALAGVAAVDLGPGGIVQPGGTLLLEGDGPIPSAVRWDRILAEGSVSAPTPQSESFLASRGADALLRTSTVKRLGPSANLGLRLVQAIRSTLRTGVEQLFPDREAGLLLGLALGDTSRLDPSLEEDFRATGLGHLLAVSGQNVAMVVAPVVGLAILLRFSPAARFVAGAGTVLMFVLLTGAEPSVLRAGVMAVVTLAGILSGRPRSPEAALGAAILTLLAADPALAVSVGFQLSVAATSGLLLLASPLTARLGFLPRPVALALATTIAAQAGVSPLLLFHFQVVPLVTLPANLLAFPAVAPAMLMGIAAAGLGHLLPHAGRILAMVALFPLRYLEGVADRLAAAPAPSVTSLSGGVVVLVVGVVVVIGAGWWLRSGRRIPRAALGSAAIVLPILLWGLALRAGPPDGLVVRFFAVGQGDAALVSSPGGVNVLIDGGPDTQEVASKLAALGVKRLDLVVGTHPHADHLEGLPAVLARFPVAAVLEPGCPEPSPAYSEFLRSVEDEAIPVRHPRAGETVFVGDLRLDVLSPAMCHEGTDSDPNNDSLVFRLALADDVVLFTGDAEVPAQEALLESRVPLEADVLKVPHHGGDTSLPDLYEAVDAAVAVVSTGPNDYGHPVPSVLRQLAESGASVLRTDLLGDVVVRFDLRGLSVESGLG